MSSSDTEESSMDVDEFIITEQLVRTEYFDLKLPRKICQNKHITSAADRLMLSDHQLTVIISAVIKAGNGDLGDFNISRQTTRRSRIANRQRISEEIIDNFRENPPGFATLHWDSKLIKDYLGSAHEQLEVIVLGAPEYIEGKLLGAPFLSDATGKSQAEASYELLELWQLVPNIVGLVFDTTASNTGTTKGAAGLFEQKLEKKLFYSACRHHILEIIIGAVWKTLFGTSMGPQNEIFGKFKEKLEYSRSR